MPDLINIGLHATELLKKIKGRGVTRYIYHFHSALGAFCFLSVLGDCQSDRN